MDKILNYTNKTIIVTGGGSGIGQAICELFASRDASVFILDVNEAGADETVGRIRSQGGQARAIRCNVASHAETADVVQSILSESKKIDVLINNAGIAHIGTLETTEEKDFDRLFQVNVDRKSTRLNSSHVKTSYAVFCLKKKTKYAAEWRTG